MLNGGISWVRSSSRRRRVDRERHALHRRDRAVLEAEVGLVDDDAVGLGRGRRRREREQGQATRSSGAPRALPSPLPDDGRLTSGTRLSRASNHGDENARRRASRMRAMPAGARESGHGTRQCSARGGSRWSPAPRWGSASPRPSASAALGMKVAMADVDADELRRAAGEVAAQAPGGAADVLALPTERRARPAELGALAQVARARFGEIGLLMNNAASAHRRRPVRAARPTGATRSRSICGACTSSGVQRLRAGDDDAAGHPCLRGQHRLRAGHHQTRPATSPTTSPRRH